MYGIKYIYIKYFISRIFKKKIIAERVAAEPRFMDHSLPTRETTEHFTSDIKFVQSD